jgi:lysozyme
MIPGDLSLRDACLTEGEALRQAFRGKDLSASKFLRSGAAILVALAILAWCLYDGVLPLNTPPRDRFPVRGGDVSHHQGAIDWPVLAGQDIRFVYIKATEGGDFKDSRFAENWQKARLAGLAVGAYHFFSPGKSGREQARNFIETVPGEADALPPVLDVECPAAPPGPEREAVRARIAECLALLEEHYGRRPVIYATREAYDVFIKGAFSRYPLWIRSVFSPPDSDALGRDWLIWQYSCRGRLAGYAGRERYIDLNVFNGGEDSFLRFWRGEP